MAAPWDNQLSALEQLDIDLNNLLAIVIANLQANAALSTSGVQRTLVDFVDVTLSSRAARRDPVAALTNSQPAMGAASATVVAANAARRYLRIKNSTAVVVFIKFGTPALVTHYPLQQFEAWETTEPSIYTGQVTGITGGAATTLDVIEG